MDRWLRRAVLERLAAVEELATRAGAALSAPLARKQIQTITVGWRELLVQHQPDSTGRCPVCSGWLRRRRWPCEVWVTAHRHLVGDGTELTRTSHPFRRPRQVVVVPRQLHAPAADRATASIPAQPGQAGRPPADRAIVVKHPAVTRAATEHAATMPRLREGGFPKLDR